MGDLKQDDCAASDGRHERATTAAHPSSWIESKAAWFCDGPYDLTPTDSRVMAIIAYLDERHEATAGLPQAEAPSQPQAPADAGAPCAACQETNAKLSAWCDADGIWQSMMESKERRLEEQAAALTAERDRLQALVDDWEVFGASVSGSTSHTGHVALEAAKREQETHFQILMGLRAKAETERDLLQAEIAKRGAVVEAAKAWRAKTGTLPIRLWPATARVLAEAVDALTQPTEDEEVAEWLDSNDGRLFTGSDPTPSAGVAEPGPVEGSGTSSPGDDNRPILMGSTWRHIRSGHERKVIEVKASAVWVGNNVHWHIGEFRAGNEWVSDPEPAVLGETT